MATSRDLRAVLAKEFTALFTNNLGPTLKVYEQELPKIKYEEDEPKKFPFVLIEVDSGKVPHSYSEDDNICQMNIITGINQDDEEQPETLSLIDRISTYLTENIVIGGLYTVASSIDWQIGEDEVMPFEYGVIQVSFKLPKIVQKQSEYI